MKNLEMDETAWRDGYLAGMKQQRADSNPYSSEDERGWAWASGYIEGKANPDTLPQMRPMPLARDSGIDTLAPPRDKD